MHSGRQGGKARRERRSKRSSEERHGEQRMRSHRGRSRQKVKGRKTKINTGEGHGGGNDRVCVCVRDYAFWDWIIFYRLIANLISHRPNEEPIGCQGALR